MISLFRYSCLWVIVLKSLSDTHSKPLLNCDHPFIDFRFGTGNEVLAASCNICPGHAFNHGICLYPLYDGFESGALW